MDDLNKRHLYLIVLKAKKPKIKPKIKEQANSVQMRTYFAFIGSGLLTVSPDGRRSWGLFYKETSPIHRSSTLMT